MAVLAGVSATELGQLFDHGQNGRTGRLCLGPQPIEIDAADDRLVLDFDGGFLWDDSEARLDAGKSGFDIQIQLYTSLIGEHPAYRGRSEETAQDGGVDDSCGHNMCLL